MSHPLGMIQGMQTTNSIVLGAWEQLAACAGADPDMFFPERGESDEPAKAICARCEVRVECLEMALDRRLVDGIFGGLTAAERRPLLQARRRRLRRGLRLAG